MAYRGGNGERTFSKGGKALISFGERKRTQKRKNEVAPNSHWNDGQVEVPLREPPHNPSLSLPETDVRGNKLSLPIRKLSKRHPWGSPAGTEKSHEKKS